jgi:uncharacterized protein RhaS with RHS repeats
MAASVSEARWYSPETGRFLTRDPLGYAGGDTNLYRFAVNNPVNYVDPNGLWSTPNHNRIIEEFVKAYNPSLSETLRSEIERGSRYADNSQAAKYSYMHHMRDGWRLQSIGDSKQLMDKYIENHLLNYECNMARGNHKNAYFELGRALHPIMDSTSPSHNDFEPWWGMFTPALSPQTVAIHAIGDAIITEQQIQVTVDRMINVLKGR